MYHVSVFCAIILSWHVNQKWTWNYRYYIFLHPYTKDEHNSDMLKASLAAAWVRHGPNPTGPHWPRPLQGHNKPLAARSRTSMATTMLLVLSILKATYGTCNHCHYVQTTDNQCPNSWSGDTHHKILYERNTKSHAYKDSGNAIGKRMHQVVYTHEDHRNCRWMSVGKWQRSPTVTFIRTMRDEACISTWSKSRMLIVPGSLSLSLSLYLSMLSVQLHRRMHHSRYHGCVAEVGRLTKQRTYHISRRWLPASSSPSGPSFEAL